jgi:hypothetical protein
MERAPAHHPRAAHLRRALQPDRTPRADGSVIVTAAPGYRPAMAEHRSQESPHDGLSPELRRPF